VNGQLHASAALSPDTHCIEGSVGPRTDMDDMGNTLPVLEIRFSDAQPYLSQSVLNNSVLKEIVGMKFIAVAMMKLHVGSTLHCNNKGCPVVKYCDLRST
jgi:hypothetical protein